MNKKTYLAPSLKEVHLTMTQVICQGTVQNVSSTRTGLKYGGGGNGPARSNERQNDAEWGNLW